MSRIEPSDDFSKGMRTIERMITEGAWAAGRSLATADFKWNRGWAVIPPPEMIDLQVRIGRRAVVGTFSRKDIEASADRVDRPEALRTIQRIIAEASQMRR